MTSKRAAIPLGGLLCAEFISLIGNQVSAVAIPVFIFKETNAAWVTGFASAINYLPYVMASMFTGYTVDRFGAWITGLAADILSFISVLALVLLINFSTGNIPSSLTLAVIFTGAIFDPFGVAARQSMIPPLTRYAGRRIEKIYSIRAGLEHTADLLGPVTAVSLISFIGIRQTLIVNAMSFGCCALLFVLTVPKRKMRARMVSKKNIFYGFGFVLSDKLLRTLAITGSITGMILMSWLGLLLLVLSTAFFQNISVLALSLTAFSISSLISALLFPGLNRYYSISFIYYAGMLLAGMGICLSGMVDTIYGVVFSAVLAGAAGAGNPLEQTILQKRTSGNFAAQVYTALPAVRMIAGVTGMIISGFLADIINIRLLLIVEGGLLITAAAVGWFYAPLNMVSTIKSPNGHPPA